MAGLQRWMAVAALALAAGCGESDDDDDEVAVGVYAGAPAPNPAPDPAPPPASVPGSLNDPFGVRKIYPTKAGGAEWFLSRTPASDPQFDPQGSIAQNADGSWHISAGQVRMNVFAPSGAVWRDVEMTGYVRLTATSSPDDEFTWYARGNRHSSSVPCEGSAYKGSIGFPGDAFWKKEIWHTGGYTGKRGVVSNATAPLLGRWIGWKVVMYNVDGGTAVKCEGYLDAAADNAWIKVNEFVDSGGWNGGSIHPDCTNPLTGAPRAIDEIILWGGPRATFRADGASFDFKHLSVREIQP